MAVRKRPDADAPLGHEGCGGSGRRRKGDLHAGERLQHRQRLALSGRTRIRAAGFRRVVVEHVRHGDIRTSIRRSRDAVRVLVGVPVRGVRRAHRRQRQRVRHLPHQQRRAVQKRRVRRLPVRRLVRLLEQGRELLGQQCVQRGRPVSQRPAVARRGVSPGQHAERPEQS